MKCSEGIDLCPCGGIARSFGEALMSSIMCDDCKDSLWILGGGFDLRKWWNKGARGRIWPRREVFRENIHFFHYVRDKCLAAAVHYQATGEIGKPINGFSEARWRNMLKQILN